MKTAIYLLLGHLLFESTIGRAVPAPKNLATLSVRNSIETRYHFLEDEPLLKPITSATTNEPAKAAENSLADLEAKVVGTKSTKSTKSRRSGDHSPPEYDSADDSDSGPSKATALPSLAEARAQISKSRGFNSKQLLFYASPVTVKDAIDLAQSATFQSKLGSYSILLTLLGQAENVAWKQMYSHLGGFWQLTSQAFAELAEDTVYVVLPDGDKSAVTWSKDSVWNLEIPILMKSKTVKTIIRINENAPHTQSYMKGGA